MSCPQSNNTKPLKDLTSPFYLPEDCTVAYHKVKPGGDVFNEVFKDVSLKAHEIVVYTAASSSMYAICDGDKTFHAGCTWKDF